MPPKCANSNSWMFPKTHCQCTAWIRQKSPPPISYSISCFTSDAPILQSEKPNIFFAPWIESEITHILFDKIFPSLPKSNYNLKKKSFLVKYTHKYACIVYQSLDCRDAWAFSVFPGFSWIDSIVLRVQNVSGNAKFCRCVLWMYSACWLLDIRLNMYLRSSNYVKLWTSKYS